MGVIAAGKERLSWLRTIDGDTGGVQTLDGARHEHSPEVPKFQVWTNGLGEEILEAMGFIRDDD